MAGTIKRKQPEESVDLIGELTFRNPTQLGHHLKVFGSCQVRIQVRLLRHVPKTLLMCDSVSFNGFASKQDLTFAGFDKAGNHF
jgi:hypothetical protein